MRVLALSGGIGGAKLAVGLQTVLAPGELTVVVNTGDDFEHLGLAICPDIDTTIYTLAGVANPELGWGRAEESWNFMVELDRLGAESWFRLGDKDLAVHIVRTHRLASGEPLGSVIGELARRLGLQTQILPMSDQPVRTLIDCEAGTLSFQHYFVQRRCEPRVRAIRYAGAAEAHPHPAALELLQSDALEAVVICPSNPYLSIEPILAIPGWRAALRSRTVPVVAVSPLIGGQAVKGPTAKIMRELNLEVAPQTIAEHYRGLIDGFVVDEADAAQIAALHLPVLIAPTLMRTADDKARLARQVLEFAATLHNLKSR